jgi:hypothetical protein
VARKSKASLVRDLIAAFLPDYLRLVEPDLAPHLDLSSVDFPDLPRPVAAVCWSVGLVAEVRTRAGEKVIVLVRVEPEGRSPANGAEGLVRSLRALKMPLAEPVWLSVIYLTGSRPGINLETARAVSLAGLDAVRIYYTAFGLEGSRAEYYLDRPEPFAWALAALMGPLRYSSADLKRACQERIRNAPLDREDRDFLLVCVEDFQPLPDS